MQYKVVNIFNIFTLLKGENLENPLLMNLNR